MIIVASFTPWDWCIENEFQNIRFWDFSHKEECQVGLNIPSEEFPQNKIKFVIFSGNIQNWFEWLLLDHASRSLGDIFYKLSSSPHLPNCWTRIKNFLISNCSALICWGGRGGFQPQRFFFCVISVNHKSLQLELMWRIFCFVSAVPLSNRNRS